MVATVVNAPLRLICTRSMAEGWPSETSSSPTDLPGQGEECAAGGGSQREVAQQAAAEVSLQCVCGGGSSAPGRADSCLVCSSGSSGFLAASSAFSGSPQHILISCHVQGNLGRQLRH